MVYAEIEGDNLQNTIADLVAFASSTAIPRNYVGDFQPPQSALNSDEPIHIITESVLLGYVGKLVKLLHFKFPQHEDYRGLDPRKSSDVPEWWTLMRPRFEKALDRFHNEIGSEYISGETAKRPLYSSNGIAACTAEDWANASIRDFVSMIDLRSILKQLIRTADPIHRYHRDGKLQHRLIVALTYSAAGRGGEVKFVNTQDWMHHARFGCTDTVWTESKTLHKYSMPMVPNKSDYTYDFYHCLGSFFMCEDGLHRLPSDAAFVSFLLPNLHSMKNASVTKKISSILQGALPFGIPEALKNDYTAKSTRRGAVSELLMHPGLNGMPDVCARTGHHLMNNSESYVDERNAFRALRGGRALAGWDNTQAHIQLPGFDSIAASHDVIDRFIDAMFTVSVPAFTRGGDLYCVLRICAASLVMYHETISSDLGPANVISSRLCEVARTADIADPSFPGVAPEVVLGHWSSAIMADFRSRNPEIQPPSADLQSLAATVLQQTAQINALSTNVNLLAVEMRRRDTLYVAQTQQVSMLSEQLHQSREENRRSRAQLTRTLTQQLLDSPTQQQQQDRNVRARHDYTQATLPPSRVDTQTVHANEAGAAIATDTTSTMNEQQEALPELPPLNNANTNDPSLGAVVAQGTVNVHPRAVQPAQRQPAHLTWNATAAQANRSKESGKNVTVSGLLQMLYRDNRFTNLNSLKNVQVPPTLSTPIMVANTLELCQCVMREEELNLFRTHTFTSEEELLRLTSVIELRAFKAMWVLEGVADVEKEYLDNKKRGSRMKKPTYMGLGTRVRNYKKEASGDPNKTNYNAFALQVDEASVDWDA